MVAYPTPRIWEASHTDTSMTINFDPWDTYDQIQISYALNSAGTNIQYASTTLGASLQRSVTATGLTPWTKYWVWGRGYFTSAGWSAWSSPSIGVTTSGPPFSPVLSYDPDSVTETSVKVILDAGYTDQTITDHQIGWSATDSNPTTSQVYHVYSYAEESQLIKTLSGLQPSKTYYIRARSQNKYGWGPWSSSMKITTLYGGHMYVTSKWEHITPWVNVQGVWKPARTLVRDEGIWKEVR